MGCKVGGGLGEEEEGGQIAVNWVRASGPDSFFAFILWKFNHAQDRQISGYLGHRTISRNQFAKRGFPSAISEIII